MEFFPELNLGFLNGWLMLASFYIVFTMLMLVLPKEVVKRLYDVSGWTRRQRMFSAAGKPFTLACLVLIVLTPLKIGDFVFWFGLLVFIAGYIGMLAALNDYRLTPIDQPVTKGVYHYSRNPQWRSLVLLFLGTCIAIGSWSAIILLSISVIFYHYRILGEETALLNVYGDSYQDYLANTPRYLLGV